MTVSFMGDIFAAIDDGISYRQYNLFRIANNVGTQTLNE